MRILAIIVLLASICYTLNAQGWERVYPEWEVDLNNDIAWWNGDTAFVADNSWKLLRTTDAGVSWKNVLEGERQLNLSSLSSNNNRLFFLASVPDLSPELLPEDSLFLVFSYDPRTGEVAEHFLPRKHPSRLPRAVHLVSTDRYLYMLEYTGVENEAIRLDLVSDEWHTSMLNHKLIEVAAVSDSILVGISRPKPGLREWNAARTTDAGATWEISPMQSGDVHALAVTANGNGIRCIVGNEAYVQYSDDTGRTWQQTTDIPWQSKTYFSVHEIIAESASRWYVLGAESGVYITTDAGISWITVKASEPTGRFLDWDITGFVSNGSDKLILAYMEGEMIQSIDGGLTWDYRFMSDISDIRYIHFFNENDGLFLGRDFNSESSMYTTTNGGAAWEKTGPIPNKYVRSIMRSWNEIYSYTISIDSVSSTITFYLSSDQGRSWEQVRESTLGPGIEQLYAFGDFWVLTTTKFTMHGGLYISSDVGETWQFHQISNMPYSPSLLDCIKQNDGSVVCYSALKEPASSTLWKSTDSCKTWIEFYKGGAGTIAQLDAVSEDTIILRRGHLVQITTNGGQDWLQVPFSGEFRTGWNCVFYLPSIYTFEGPVRVRHSSDFWATSTVQLDLNPILASMSYHFLDRNHGWLAYESKMYRTSTGGVNALQNPVVVANYAALESIYPNPVTGGQSATIEIAIPAGTLASGAAAIHISVHDILGRQVAELSNANLNPGNHTLTWQPQTTLSAGLYFVRMIAGSSNSVKQVLLLR